MSIQNQQNSKTNGWKRSHGCAGCNIGGNGDIFQEEESIFCAKRYQLGARTLICMGQLADDFGQRGDAEVARKLLGDSYTFPSDCDKATIALLHEAAKL